MYPLQKQNISGLVLSNKEIIQIDATIITGLLILLTISSFVQVGDQSPIGRTPFEVAAFLIVPFALSAFIAVAHSFITVWEQKVIKGHRAYLLFSLGLTFLGFLWIFVIFLQLAFDVQLTVLFKSD